MLKSKNIPHGVILISIFLLVNGIILAIVPIQIIINRSFDDWVRNLFWHPLVQLTFWIPTESIQLPDPWYVSVLDVGVGVQFLILLFGIAQFLGIFGIYLFKKWTRNFIIILMCINIFSIIPLTVILIPALGNLSPIGSLISGGIPIVSFFIIHHMRRPHIKNFFSNP
ncbi:MAG: hypothetical protein ACT4N5_05745 [Nitrosopumilaceae archaeon]